MVTKEQEFNNILKHSLKDLKNEGYKVKGKKNISRLRLLIKEIYSFYEQNGIFNDEATAQQIVSQVAKLIDVKPTLKNADYYMLIMAITGLVGKYGTKRKMAETEMEFNSVYKPRNDLNDAIRFIKWVQHHWPDPEIDIIIESLIANCEKDEIDREYELKKEIIQTTFPDIKELNQVIDIPIIRWYTLQTHATMRQLYSETGCMPDFETVIQRMEIKLVKEPIEYAQAWYLWKKTKKLQKKIHSAMISLESARNEDIS